MKNTGGLNGNSGLPTRFMEPLLRTRVSMRPPIACQGQNGAFALRDRGPTEPLPSLNLLG